MVLDVEEMSIVVVVLTSNVILLQVIDIVPGNKYVDSFSNIYCTWKQIC